MRAKVKNILPEVSRRDNLPKVDRLSEDDMIKRQRRRDQTGKASGKLPYQRVERKSPWEPRSFTEDNAFHHGPGSQATDEAEEWGEVSVSHLTSALE
jgi:hypothetical protein